MLIHCDKVPNKKSSQSRKTPSDCAFAVFDSVTMVNAEHWNKVQAHGSTFLSIPYLTALENQPPENMRFHYSIIYKNMKPVAIAYFQVIDFSSESFGSMIEDEGNKISCMITDYLKKHFKRHLLRSADHINMRLLICGNAFISGEHGFAMAPGISRAEAFDALADVIYRISRAEKLRGKIAAVLVKDFYRGSLKSSDELQEFRYHDFLVEPNMIVDISWTTFSDYLNAMSKKYRNRAKTIIKKGAALERRDFSAEDILHHQRRIQTLYNNVHLKAKFRMASVGPAYFAELKAQMPETFQFTAYYLEDKFVGFRTTFLLPEETEAHFIGLDYKVNKELELYQNILYDYLQDALRAGSKRLSLGRTASEIKSTIGAEAHELTCYIRHRNPLSNQIIRPFIEFLKPSDWVPRNPFKEIGISS
jgi:hypothetical protein